MEIKLLKDVCSISKGQQINGDDLLKKGNYKFFNGGINASGYWNEYNVKENSISISEGGNSCGYVNYQIEPFWCGAHCYYLYDLKVSSKYLYYYLKYRESDLMAIRSGVCMPNIKKKDLENFKINLKSIDNQHDVINTLEKIESLIQINTKKLEKFDEIVKSQFIEMFGDPITNNKNWKTDKLQNIIAINKYKGNVEVNNGKVWLLNLDMIESKSGNILGAVYENEEDVPNSTIKFNSDCVLYSKLRPYLNKVVIPHKSGYATSELISMNPNSLINKFFLANLLRYDSFVNFANGTAYGAKMPRASVDEIKNFKLIVPPIDLQNKFANFVQQIDKSKFIVQKQIKLLEELLEKKMNEYFGQ